MAANVYLTDVLSSVSTINAAVREVMWGIVQVIACKTSFGDDEVSENCIEDTEDEKEELALEMMSKDLPLTFGNSKRKRKKRQRLTSVNNTGSPSFDGDRSRRIRLPRSKHHMFLEQNIMMGFYNDDGNWYPCRVLGNSHIGKFIATTNHHSLHN